MGFERSSLPCEEDLVVIGVLLEKHLDGHGVAQALPRTLPLASAIIIVDMDMLV